MKGVLRVVAVAVLLALAYPGYLAFRIWDRSHEDQVHTADAIVVLGAAQYNGRPSPVLQARLDQAAYLYSEGIAATVIVTGGKQPGDRFTEAEASLHYLLDQGIPEEAILTEPEGNTTWESLKGVRAIARERGIGSAIFVSDPLHSERVRRMATDLGFDGVYTSYASYERLNRSRRAKLQQLVREVGSLLMYELLQR